MKVTPPSPAYHVAYNQHHPKPPVSKVARSYGAQVLDRQANICQLLYDALTPFVDAYEASAPLTGEPEHTPDNSQVVQVTMADIRRAQSALRLITTDIYA